MINPYGGASLAREHQRELLREVERQRLAAQAMAGKPAWHDRMLASIARSAQSLWARVGVRELPVTQATVPAGAQHQ